MKIRIWSHGLLGWKEFLRTSSEMLNIRLTIVLSDDINSFICIQMCLTQIFIFRGFCKLWPKFGHTSIKIKLSLLALVMLHKNQSYAVYLVCHVKEKAKCFSTLIFDLITYKMKEKCIMEGESQVHDCIEWLMG